MKLTIKEVVEHYRKKHKVETVELAMSIGIRRACLYDRYKNPSNWRLGELNGAYDLLDVPEEDRVYEV